MWSFFLLEKTLVVDSFEVTNVMKEFRFLHFYWNSSVINGWNFAPNCIFSSCLERPTISLFLCNYSEKIKWRKGSLLIVRKNTWIKAYLLLTFRNYLIFNFFHQIGSWMASTVYSSNHLLCGAAPGRLETRHFDWLGTSDGLLWFGRSCQPLTLTAKEIK